MCASREPTGAEEDARQARKPDLRRSLLVVRVVAAYSTYMIQPRLTAKLRLCWILVTGITTTVLTEVITLWLRFGTGRTAAEFNRTAPLFLQIHHMFWSLPLLLVLPLCWRRAKLSGTLLGVALGFIVSDLMHHFLVLPIMVGNMGWHWP